MNTVANFTLKLGGIKQHCDSEISFTEENKGAHNLGLAFFL